MFKKGPSRFLLRLNEDLYNELKKKALRGRVSINELCTRFIAGGLRGERASPWWQGDADTLVSLIKKNFGRSVLGVLLFGSQIQGTATADSDLDVLIVLDSSIPLRRSLYSWWDDAVLPHIDERINPQFVHAPIEPSEVGGIWYEVALSSYILWERGRVVTTIVKKLRTFIDEDHVRRYFAHGQPYWVRRGDEEYGSGA